ncbi:hypothetical protein [Telmatospirillum sp.]|uniref:hypothetical protein n=1 Tax=Telmatospirillum sp. TaxID=2079197 RepID=UPI00283EDC9A|nr:hypothetical protein [Telmatospirillum sp.]MDR3437937.1 hypothetical protein [Telmatospirillum sp.]
MKALKALVIGMGVLIIVGLALVGYGLSNNSLRKPPPAVAGGGAVPLSGEPAGRAYYSVEVPVTAGNHLEQMAVSGDKVLLRFAGSEGDRILVVDPQTGHLSGTISLVPQKP